MVVRKTGWRPSASTAGLLAAWLSGAGVVGDAVAGTLVAGGAVTAGGWLVAVSRWSGWLLAQPATARLATSRAVAIDRMGRMVLIPFWTARTVVQSF